MAFGRKQTLPDSSGEKKLDFFATNTIPLSVDEKRTIRLLPAADGLPEPEISAYGLWIPVTIEGATTQPKRRIFVDRATKKNLPESLQRNCIWRSWMNVYDLSPVIVVEQDPNDPNRVQLAYKNARDQFVTGWGEKQKVHDGKGTPNKRIMILEYMYKLQQVIEGLPSVTVRLNQETEESEPVDLLDMTIDFVVRKDAAKNELAPVASGTAIPANANRDYVKLPRYNVHEAFKPWPEEAVFKVLEGEDFNKVVEEYKIIRIPTLQIPKEEMPF